MQPNTLTRREYKGKIYVENIRKDSSRIRNHLKSRIQIRIWILNKLFWIRNTVRYPEVVCTVRLAIGFKQMLFIFASCYWF